MIGTLYEIIASNVLREAFPNMASRELSDILARGNPDELENYVDLAEPVRLATEALCQAVEPYGIPLPKYLYTVVTKSRNPQLALSEVHSIKMYSNVSSLDCGRIIVRILRVIHDYQVSQSSDLFFEKEYVGEQFKYMPLELNGFDEAVGHLVYIEPVLEAIDLDVDTHFIERAYNEAQDEFMRENGISTVEDLVAYVECPDYDGLSAYIREELRTNATVVNRIVNQILYRNELFW